MSKLIPVIYRNMEYPHGIKANVNEISGNFNKEKLIINSFYSLHTDSASKKRKFDSKIFNGLVHLKKAQKDGIPQLWYDRNWANDFYNFIDCLIGENKAPEVLEIHPPFINYPIFDKCRISTKKFDYREAFKIFLDIFNVFYEKFKEICPETIILIENRGSSWAGRFLLSKPSDIEIFADILKGSGSKLKIVLDYPQIFSALYISAYTKEKKELQDKGILIDDDILKSVILLNNNLENFKKAIGGFHMWGKQKDENGIWRSHSGNFNTLFSDNANLKKKFLMSVYSTFNDDEARYFVPEVNSGAADFYSIVTDMVNINNNNKGFIFMSET